MEEFDTLGMRPEKKFVKWRALASEGEPSNEYWTATQYYVSEGKTPIDLFVTCRPIAVGAIELIGIISKKREYLINRCAYLST